MTKKLETEHNPVVNQAANVLFATVKMQVDAKSRASVFAMLIGNTAEHIPDEEWEDMVAAAQMPCGKVDCDCHGFSGPLFDFLNRERKRFRQ